MTTTLGRTLIAAVAAALAGIAMMVAGASTAIAKDCKLSVDEQRSFGPTYVQQLETKGVSCRKGKKVVRAYHQCRYAAPKPGLKGRCTNKVKKFKCDEGKRTKLPGANYWAKVSCKQGSAKVSHIYQQSH